VTIHRADGTTTEIVTTARCDTPVDVRYLANGGILQTVIRNLVG
jgi:aconitase A